MLHSACGADRFMLMQIIVALNVRFAWPRFQVDGHGIHGSGLITALLWQLSQKPCGWRNRFAESSFASFRDLFRPNFKCRIMSNRGMIWCLLQGTALQLPHQAGLVYAACRLSCGSNSGLSSQDPCDSSRAFCCPSHFLGPETQNEARMQAHHIFAAVRPRMVG